MSRRAIRLVLAAVMLAVAVAAVVVGRMTAASAQVGMRRAPARRVPRPAVVPTGNLVVVRAGQGGGGETMNMPAEEPPGVPPPLSRSALATLVGGPVGDVWLDLTPRRPCIPYKGHLSWWEAATFIATQGQVPDGVTRLRGRGGYGGGCVGISVRPQVSGARYLVDCTMSVNNNAPMTIAIGTTTYTASVMDSHLVFIWETRPVADTGATPIRTVGIGCSSDEWWSLYRCQLTFLGGPE